MPPLAAARQLSLYISIRAMTRFRYDIASWLEKIFLAQCRFQMLFRCRLMIATRQARRGLRLLEVSHFHRSARSRFSMLYIFRILNARHRGYGRSLQGFRISAAASLGARVALATRR